MGVRPASYRRRSPTPDRRPSHRRHHHHHHRRRRDDSRSTFQIDFAN